MNLINDLDEISKLERGEQVIYKQNFIIQELVKEVFESLSIKAEQKNIRCSIKKGCESPLTVFADKEKIRQVILNLVENSIKYGKYGGNITASMYITDEKHVLVEISDDGIGMAERHLSRIFERFYRTEEGRSLDITGQVWDLPFANILLKRMVKPFMCAARSILVLRSVLHWKERKNNDIQQIMVNICKK